MSFALSSLSSASTYMFFCLPNLPFIIFDLLCVFLPTTGYLDQIRVMLKTKSSSNFKMHSSLVLLLSNYLRLLYSFNTKFEAYLVWQSVATISIHLTLAFLYYYYQPKSPHVSPSMPEGLQEFYSKKRSIYQFKPYSSDSFAQFMFSLATVYIGGVLAYFIASMFFEISLVSEVVGILSNGVDCLVTLPQFIIVVIQRDTKYVTILLVGQWVFASVFKAVLFLCRPVPWPFRFGVGVQAIFTIMITVSYFQITLKERFFSHSRMTDVKYSQLKEEQK